jgi:hypothetical protein
LEIKQDDFGDAVFEILKRIWANLSCCPDAIALDDMCYKTYIQFCNIADMQSPFEFWC